MPTTFSTEPIAAAGTLADRVTEILLQKIHTGELAVNALLPSEQSLAESFAVSRTVIREAISRLKSEGLVETRQGKGTVVIEPGLSPFRITVDVNDSVQAVLRVVELRRGIEAEMSALAAERRTEEQNTAIQQALQAIDTAVKAGREGVEEDLAFHAAISVASGNPLYTSLLQFLSQYLRDAVRVGRLNEAQRGDFIGQLHAEHSAIADAIANRDPLAASRAARQHLENVALRINAADARFWNSEGGKVAQNLAKSPVPKL